MEGQLALVREAGVCGDLRQATRAAAGCTTEERRGVGLRARQCWPSGRLMADAAWFLVGTQDAYACMALARAKQFVHEGAYVFVRGAGSRSWRRRQSPPWPHSMVLPAV